MRIVHCIFSLKTGGAESLLIDILNEQVKTNQVFLIIVNAVYEPDLISKINETVKVFFINRPPSRRSLYHLCLLNYKLFFLHPDAIHVHSISLAGVILPVLYYKMFFTAHCIGISSKYFHCFKKIFAISNAVKRDVLSKGDFPVIVIPNGISIEQIACRSDLMISETFKIVQVARLNSELKGQDILIEAISLLKVKRPDIKIRVDFIGEGNSGKSLEILARKMGVAESVRFLGLRDRDYVYAHLKGYDLLCHPARSEGFGLTVAEAMAAKLPVLVATGDGPFEIIKEGKLGSYFKNSSVDDCANKIALIYDRYQDVLDKVEEARNCVIKKYSLEFMSQQYTINYD